MNSQELEESLKAEFESHINSVIAEMKRELAEFQGVIQSELEQQRARTEEAFQSFSQRIESRSGLSGGFGELVSEHLKLARDEGAKLAATAYSEAEMMSNAAEPAPAPADYAGLRNAVAEISAQNSQATILSCLVDKAADFAPRGAFFIVKNERFVGWRTFGDNGAGEDAIKNISLATSDNSILAKASSSTEAVAGSYGEHDADPSFLGPLHFGQPERMYSIPLVVRGRSVAVLYADAGMDGSSPNPEALETLVRVAGMTVELLAAAATPAPAEEHAESQAQPQAEAPAPSEEYRAEEEHETVSMEGGPSYDQPAQDAEPYRVFPSDTSDGSASPYTDASPGFEYQPQEASVEHVEPEAEAFQYEGTPEPVYQEDASDTEYQGIAEPVYQQEVQADDTAQYQETPFAAYPETPQPAPSDPAIASPTAVEPPSYFHGSPAESKQEEYQPETPRYQPEPAPPEYKPSVSFDAPASIGEPASQSPFERSIAPFEPASPIGAGMGAHTLEKAPDIAASPAPPRARLSDRNVDLPIEVPEADRRMHNDARRFARLLVSEIKLYNEKKVTEGRQAADLYGRLKEAIDRSREMYDKRVQPPVAAKFDYFHYELVNSLADGDAGKFGNGYPGASV